MVRIAGLSCAWSILLVAASGCVPPQLRTVQEFRAARAKGDLAAARSYLCADPRVWWGERKGDGSPWQLGGGRWKGWDEFFNGTGTAGEWIVSGRSVSAPVMEMNDYYRLTERGPQEYLRTYFFDESGLIEGTMISTTDDDDRPRGRADEFDRWLQGAEPEEYEYLRPGGRIDPTGDRPSRTRVMLEEWRRQVGLP